MVTFSDLASVPSDPPVPFTDRLRLAVAAYLLKQFRAVATRYDKREFMYKGTVDVASIRIWLQDPVP